MFPSQGNIFEIGAADIKSPLAVISLHLKSEQQGPVSPCCYFTSLEIITARVWSPLPLDRRFCGNIYISIIKFCHRNFRG